MLFVGGARAAAPARPGAAAAPVGVVAAVHGRALPHAAHPRLSRSVAATARTRAFSSCSRSSPSAPAGSSGVGLGQSKQKMFFLPEAHTDFIFALVGEELGADRRDRWCWRCSRSSRVRGFRVAARHPDPFASLLAFGFTASAHARGGGECRGGGGAVADQGLAAAVPELRRLGADGAPCCRSASWRRCRA